MTKDQVAGLAADKSDEELLPIIEKYGALPLACDYDGVDIDAEPYKSTQFSRSNPFVHFAIRAGYVEAVKVNISDKKVFQGIRVADSKSQSGEDLPIHHTLFKGESV